jgi:hypothetical protein
MELAGEQVSMWLSLVRWYSVGSLASREFGLRPLTTETSLIPAVAGIFGVFPHEPTG